MNKQAYKDLTGFDLKDRGHNYVSLCVSHSEETPSFFIHKDTYVGHCFGCGVKGYLDNILAKAYEIPAKTIRDDLDIPISSRFNTGISVNEVPSFQQSWLAAFPKIQMHPLLAEKGFEESIVIQYGTRWDPNDARIVFPLMSLGGPIVGATGRTTIAKDPKWYFYWAAAKGEILYSVFDSIDFSASSKHGLIIVEGIFDAMKLNQAGYNNVVALLGAQVSKKQLMLIRAHANLVTLFLDNDEAGRMGQASLARSLSRTMRVNCVTYTRGKDPCGLTEDEITDRIESSETYVEYTNNLK